MSDYDAYFDASVVNREGEMTSLDGEVILEGLAPSQVLASGAITSQDNRMSLDLGGNNFVVNDGLVDRTQLGKFADGQYGFRVTDQSGNTLMNITGENNKIVSADGKMIIDLTNNRILINDGTNDRILIGYDANGF